MHYILIHALYILMLPQILESHSYEFNGDFHLNIKI